jgi:hypothetical protein
MFYQWFKGSHSGSCEYASSYYLVVGMPISMGRRDHPSGATHEASTYQLSSPRGYPFFDTNLEGTKGLSLPKWRNIARNDFSTILMKSMH